ncbi:MAG: peptide chain release factor 3 [Bdellovibrionales bacterium]|nr:peptide chain release factor 3 [Bdellovibrionales bacterium]
MDPKLQTQLAEQVARRRTFAIISHPDAGKTTLTEKLLLYGGAIHLAGAVKGKKSQKSTTSDWMELEKQRGISISSTVLQFEYQGTQINLLDTPGHKDFSEDTYRTLMAADAAVMLIDGAKGVEPQTRKLFEVCRLRDIPIFTFVNKMDRPSREPLDLIDELEKVLGIRSAPMTWPIGSGDRFRGVYARDPSLEGGGELHLFDTGGNASVSKKLQADRIPMAGKSDEELAELFSGESLDVYDGKALVEALKAELELLEFAGDPYDHERVLKGALTPVFFGSAISNFGVEWFLQNFIRIAPPPGPRESSVGVIEPTDPRFSSFVFKIQANMDPQHRDRVAFMRICSGRFERNLEAQHLRTGKPFKMARPLNFFGQERVIVEEAWPGDVVGMVDTTGSLRIGDTLATGKPAPEYEGMPSFSPEHFAQVLIKDPMKRKQLQKGLEQLSEEGVVQVYRQRGLGDKDPILGAVGALQFEVLQFRLQAEYGAESRIERLPFTLARWVRGPGFDAAAFEREDSRCLEDRDGNPVVLFKTEWGFRYARENHKALEFLTTAPRG